ncbi:MAG: hypothetical protein IJV36_01360 [Prevotella sp.]|nr:hypothetical protein [Prevotella sp.]
MTLSEFSYAINRFYEEKENDVKDLTSLLQVAHDYFFVQFDRIDVPEFSHVKYKTTLKPLLRKAELRKELETDISSLKNLITRCTNPAWDLAAMDEFYKFFFKSSHAVRDSHMLTSVKPKHCFYRMRSASKYEVYNRKGIFQIPSDKLRLVSRLRFSDDGHACLYLGESLYIAWEEVRRQNFDTVNFALFQNTKELSVLDLTIQPKCIFKGHFLMAFCSILSSAKVSDDDKYKYRYEFPGLLMKALQNNIACGGDVHGIKYVSSRRFDGKDIVIESSSKTHAYVFPPRQPADADVDKWLSDTFLVSEVRTSFLYNIHRLNFPATNVAVTSGYQDTLFYQYEEQLKNEKLEKVK